jgi:ParB family chromosome partitioning protein
MKKLDETTALAIVFANTKRKKRREDLLTVAHAFDYLVKLYGSQKAVAEKVGLSTEMVREFLGVLKLPEEIRRLISERKIDKIDIVREILSLKESSKQIMAAEAFINSLSKDVRDIKRVIKNANLPVEDAKKVIIDTKPKGLHIFIMDFDDETYQEILKQSKVLKIKPAELVKGIVTEWLKQRKEKQ